METIPLLIIIIAILGFLVVALVNCAEEQENKKAIRIKGGDSSASKLKLKELGKKAPSAAKLKVKNERPTMAAKKMASSSKVVQVPAATPKSSIGETKSVVFAPGANPSSSVEAKNSTGVETRIKLPFHPDLGPILVDQKTYEKYVVGPSRKSVVNGKSSVCTSTLPGSESSRLSNYKTQSFGADANSKTGVQQEDDKKEVKKEAKKEKE